MHETPPTHRALVLFRSSANNRNGRRGGSLDPPRSRTVVRFSRLLEVEKRISDARDAALATGKLQ